VSSAPGATGVLANVPLLVNGKEVPNEKPVVEGCDANWVTGVEVLKRNPPELDVGNEKPVDALVVLNPLLAPNPPLVVADLPKLNVDG